MKNDFYFALKTLFVLERAHPFSNYTKFSEKLTFLAPTRTCAYQGVRMLVFQKILRTCFMDDPKYFCNSHSFSPTFTIQSVS